MDVGKKKMDQKRGNTYTSTDSTSCVCWLTCLGMLSSRRGEVWRISKDESDIVVMLQDQIRWKSVQ